VTLETSQLARRPVVTTFRLKHQARLRVSVRELEPVCRIVGRYRLTAYRGVNRLRLPKRIGTTKLGVGTYALLGQTLLGRRVFDVVAAVHRKQGRLLARVRHTSAASSCRATDAAGIVGVSLTRLGTAASEAASGAKGARRTASPANVFKPPAASAPRPHRSPLVRAATFDNAPLAIRPLLYALLAISIGLLAAAAAPNTVMPAGAAAAFVASKRAYLAAAGIWLLVVVAIIAALA
jgi:hypothetical protein